MKVFYVIIFAIIMASCTNVEKYYFYCISYDEDGKCIEWAEMDTDPRVDNEVDKDEIINTDEDKIIENDIDNPTDTENENDEDSFIPDPDEEITQDFDYPEIPDEDMCGNPCILLRDQYNNWLGKDRDSGELMSIATITDGCMCRIELYLEQGYQELFYGYFFPVVSEIENSLDLGSSENEIIFTTKADGKKRYFEKQ